MRIYTYQEFSAHLDDCEMTDSSAALCSFIYTDVVDRVVVE